MITAACCAAARAARTSPRARHFGVSNRQKKKRVQSGRLFHERARSARCLLERSLGNPLESLEEGAAFTSVRSVERPASVSSGSPFDGTDSRFLSLKRASGEKARSRVRANPSRRDRHSRPFTARARVVSTECPQHLQKVGRNRCVCRRTPGRARRAPGQARLDRGRSRGFLESKRKQFLSKRRAVWFGLVWFGLVWFGLGPRPGGEDSPLFHCILSMLPFFHLFSNEPRVCLAGKEHASRASSGSAACVPRDSWDNDRKHLTCPMCGHVFSNIARRRHHCRASPVFPSRKRSFCARDFSRLFL